MVDTASWGVSNFRNRKKYQQPRKNIYPLAMGNSAQQHRVAIGLYAGCMSSRTWSHAPGSGPKRRKQCLKSEIALAELSSEIACFWFILLRDVVSTLHHLVNIVLTILTLAHITCLGVGNIFRTPTGLPSSTFLNVTVSSYDFPVAAQVTKTLLLVSHLSFTLRK